MAPFGDHSGFTQRGIDAMVCLLSQDGMIFQSACGISWDLYRGLTHSLEAIIHFQMCVMVVGVWSVGGGVPQKQLVLSF